MLEVLTWLLFLFWDWMIGKERVKPLQRICMEIIQTSLAFMSTFGNMFFERRVENSGINALVCEVMPMSWSIDAITRRFGGFMVT